MLPSTLFILLNHPTYPFFWDSSNLTLTRLPSRDSTFTFHFHFDQVGEGYQAVTPLSLSSCSLEWLLDCTYGGALPQVALLLFHLNIIILYHFLKKKHILGGGRSCDAYGPTSVLGMRQSLGQRGSSRVCQIFGSKPVRLGTAVKPCKLVCWSWKKDWTTFTRLRVLKRSWLRWMVQRLQHEAVFQW